MKTMTMMTMTIMMVTTMVLTIMLLLMMMMKKKKILPPGVITTVIMAGTDKGIVCFVSIPQKQVSLLPHFTLHKHSRPNLGSEEFVLVLFDK